MVIKLDAQDHKILAELTRNARVPIAELARRVGLSVGDEAVLRQLIDETLQIQEAAAKEITVTPQEIDQSFARVAKNFDGRTPEQSNLAEMDRLWDAAKAAEKPAW